MRLGHRNCHPNFLISQHLSILYNGAFLLCSILHQMILTPHERVQAVLPSGDRRDRRAREDWGGWTESRAMLATLGITSISQGTEAEKKSLLGWPSGDVNTWGMNHFQHWCWVQPMAPAQLWKKACRTLPMWESPLFAANWRKGVKICALLNDIVVGRILSCPPGLLLPVLCPANP